jgi:hypothetical protein
MQDTKLAVSQGQEREWVEREQAAGGSSGGDGYHFICEVFFMTLQVGQTAWQVIETMFGIAMSASVGLLHVPGC